MASSFPQFYTDYSISNFSQFPFPPPVTGENSGVSTSSGGTICSSNGNCGGGGGAMWVSEENNYLPATFGNSLLLPQESGAAPGMCSFPEQIGGMEPVVSGTFMPEFNMGFSGINDICCSGQEFGATYGDQQQQQQQQIPNVVNVCEYGDECCGFMQEFNKPMYPGENWGIQNNGISAVMEEGSVKVGRYSAEERRDRILRYLRKKNQRNFNKTIKYACRKTLADRRVRIRGRFARNNELIREEETTMKKNVIKNLDRNSDDHLQKEKEFYSTDAYPVKEDDQDWLQEAMSSLMYLPYIS